MTRVFLPCVALLIAAIQAPGPTPNPDPVVADLLAAHNRERAKEEKPPLTIAPKLVEAAKAHADDMAEHETMSHEGSDGSEPAERVKRRGYRFVRTGENVAFGQQSVDSVVEAWMNSPHHRENILGDFSAMGGARVVGGEGTPYWCVVFGTPLTQLDPTRAAEDLVEELNKARSEAEARVLKVGPALVETAKAEARRMAGRDALQADAEKGKAPSGLDKLAKAQARRYQSIGQSLATGYPTAREVVSSLLESPDQKKTLLGNYDEIGVGYANAEDGTPYWCLILARSRR